MNAPATITILGREWPVKIPPQFAVREELVAALGEASDHGGRTMRAYGAIVGVCTTVGREAGADYVKARFDAFAYGGAVYGWLREQGATPQDVTTAGAAIFPALTAGLFPREPEVKERADFFNPVEAR